MAVRRILGRNHVDDILYASAGADFNGLGGNDTLVFDGMFSDYAIQLQVAANLKAKITDASGNVIDSKMIETFKFANGSYDVKTGVFTPDAPVMPTISVSDASVTEGGILRFTISLSGMSDVDVTGELTTQPGTAFGLGSDYFGYPPGTPFTIPAGATSIEIQVQTLQDSQVETDETMSLVISNVVNATIADDRGTGTIINDDVAPTAVWFYADPTTDANSPFNLYEEGGPFVFHFHRDNADAALDVRYWISNNLVPQVTPGVDFTMDGVTFVETDIDVWSHESMVVHFGVGQTEAQLVFHAVDDGIVEEFGEPFAVHFDFANNDPSIFYDGIQSTAAYMAAGGTDETQLNIAHIHDVVAPII